MPLVVIEQKDKAKYPIKDFNPGKNYPEYTFGETEINPDENDAYELVRNSLAHMELDAEHFGGSDWNPLGAYIKPGNFVVVKPNWVHHENSNPKVKVNPLECLITNPSCVRAVCDYALIALKGKGKIIVCDSPIQDCDFDLLWKSSGYDKLRTFYQNKNANVEFQDLRTYQRIVNCFAVRTQKKSLQGKAVQVRMDNHFTAFAQIKNQVEYSVPNYDKFSTNSLHQVDKHIYSISNTVLKADVIINFCKPKCHRYAGITAALKNVVGTVAEKESLPHRRLGSIEEGGDSYSHKSAVKHAIDNVLQRQVEFENAHKIGRANLCRFTYGILYYLRKMLHEDNSIKGCWHGNDTIWRTIMDLNYILNFADKNGNLQKVKQRKVLNMADMIIAGQHNGPLSPEPKQLGIILASDSAAELDMTVCKIMGFDGSKIPLFNAIQNQKTWIKWEEPTIKSNQQKLCRKLNEVEFPPEWKFEPHDAWK